MSTSCLASTSGIENRSLETEGREKIIWITRTARTSTSRGGLRLALTYCLDKNTLNRTSNRYKKWKVKLHFYQLTCVMILHFLGSIFFIFKYTCLCDLLGDKCWIGRIIWPIFYMTYCNETLFCQEKSIFILNVPSWLFLSKFHLIVLWFMTCNCLYSVHLTK